jgi:hypothetical protein
MINTTEEINLKDLPNKNFNILPNIYKYPKYFIIDSEYPVDINWGNIDIYTLIEFKFNDTYDKIIITIPEIAIIKNNNNNYKIYKTFEINVTNVNKKVTIERRPNDIFTHITNNLNINVKKEKVGEKDKYSFFIDEHKLSQGGARRKSRRRKSHKKKSRRHRRKSVHRNRRR